MLGSAFPGKYHLNVTASLAFRAKRAINICHMCRHNCHINTTEAFERTAERWRGNSIDLASAHVVRGGQTINKERKDEHNAKNVTLFRFTQNSLLTKCTCSGHTPHLHHIIEVTASFLISLFNLKQTQ